jgi:hypothetical protein
MRRTMKLTERPWSRPIRITPLPESHELYGFGMRHHILYPDDTWGAATTVECARGLANGWMRTHAL